MSPISKRHYEICHCWKSWLSKSQSLGSHKRVLQRKTEKELTAFRVSGHNSPLLLIHSTVKWLVSLTRLGRKECCSLHISFCVCLFVCFLLIYPIPYFSGLKSWFKQDLRVLQMHVIRASKRDHDWGVTTKVCFNFLLLVGWFWTKLH